MNSISKWWIKGVVNIFGIERKPLTKNQSIVIYIELLVMQLATFGMLAWNTLQMIKGVFIGQFFGDWLVLDVVVVWCMLMFGTMITALLMFNENLFEPKDFD